MASRPQRRAGQCSSGRPCSAGGYRKGPGFMASRFVARLFSGLFQHRWDPTGHGSQEMFDIGFDEFLLIIGGSAVRLWTEQASRPGQGSGARLCRISKSHQRAQGNLRSGRYGSGNQTGVSQGSARSALWQAPVGARHQQPPPSTEPATTMGSQTHLSPLRIKAAPRSKQDEPVAASC